MAGFACVLREGAHHRQAPPLRATRRSMPELPEVETTMRALAARLRGRQIAALDQRRPDLRFPLPERLAERLIGRRLIGFGRRAKYILGHLDDQQTLLLHLGMSGRLLFDGPPAGPHEHLTFHFDDASCLRFVDPRRFGMLDLTPHGGAAGASAARRPRPRAARRRLRRTRARGRARRPPDRAQAGADGSAGGGRGGQHLCLRRPVPGAAVATADRRPPAAARGRRLAEAVRTVLLEAIEAGGSSLRDYVQTDGQLGFFQERFAVYGLSGQPCRVCSGADPTDRPGQSRRLFFARAASAERSCLRGQP